VISQVRGVTGRSDVNNQPKHSEARTAGGSNNRVTPVKLTSARRHRCGL